MLNFLTVIFQAFSRHKFTDRSQGVHKEFQDTEAQIAYGKTIRDPKLSENGESQAKRFNDKPLGENRAAYVDHILSSPMLRTMSTACRAFCSMLLKHGGTIIALPELQNMDKKPNGTGTETVTLQGKWKDGFHIDSSEADIDVDVDVWTFMCNDWIFKESGRWSPEEVKWRIGFLKGFLKGIYLGGGRKKVEVAMVTHGSFIREMNRELFLPPSMRYKILLAITDLGLLLDLVKDKEAEVTSCVFDEEGGFQEVSDEELRVLREKWGN